jgi:hypothetical protein
METQARHCADEGRLLTGTLDTWQITAWERLAQKSRPVFTRWKTLMDTFSWGVRRRRDSGR